VTNDTVTNNKRVTVWIAVALFVFALGFRIIGINWGLKNDFHNQSYHPDELIIFAGSQRIEPTAGKFTPGFYNYGTAYLTALRVASDIVTGYTGGPKENDPDSLWEWVSRVHLAGRTISAVCGAGTAVLVFLTLRRFLGLFGSIFGALVPAIAPAFVVHSRFQTVDVPSVFWIALAVFAACRLVPTEDDSEPSQAARWALISGFGAGMAAGTKYTGILVLATLYVCLFTGLKKDALRLALLGSVAAILTFLVVTPGVLLDTEKFLQDFRYEITHTGTGHGLVFVGTAPGFLYHLANLMVGFGPLLSLLGVCGLVLGVAQKRPWLIGIALFCFLTYILIGRAEVKFLRYTFPLVIGMSAGFGVVMDWAEKQKQFGRVVAALGIAGIGGIDPGGLRLAMNFTMMMAGEDPRDTAVKYLRTTSGNVGLASDPWFYTVPTFKDSAASRAVPFEARMESMAFAEPPTVFYRPADEPPYNFDLRLLSELKPNRIAVSSFEYGDPLRIRAAGVEPADPVEKLLVDRGVNFMTELRKQYEIEKSFGFDGAKIHDLEYIRPEVLIWKRKLDPIPTP
jgi:hypothetical protein